MSDIVVSNLPLLVDVASVGIQGAQGIQGALGPVGPMGPQGPQGLPGAAVGIGEAPTDGTIYGRKGNTATWLNVLGLATGGTVSAATTFSSTLAASGGGSVAGTFSGTPTWSGAHTFNAGITSAGVTCTTVAASTNTNFGRGGTFTLSGSALDVTKFGLYANNNIAGTSTFTEVPGVAYISLGSANIAAPASLIDAMSVVMVTGGAAAASGGWQALSASCNDGALATNDKAGGGLGVFIAAQLARRVSRSQGGTGLTPTTCFGSNWGMDIVNAIQSTATNLNLQNGLEINQSVNTGGSVMRRSGLQISSPVSHTTRGALWDYGISFLLGGTATLRQGIGFGGALSPHSPLGSDSGLLTYQLSQDFTATANIGVDFNDVTFTTASLRMPGGMAVSPTGVLQLSTAFLTPTTTGLSIDAAGSVATGVPTITAGGTGYGGNEQMDDGHGGVYTVNGVTGGVITAVNVIAQPTSPTTSPPTTLTLTSRAPGVGTGCVLTPTWSTTRTTLALQPTAGGKMTMPALQASTTYANDAAAATGGVAVGQIYRNGSAVQIRVS